MASDVSGHPSGPRELAVAGRRVLIGAALIAVAGYCWWATSLPKFHWPVEVATGIPCIGAVLYAGSHADGRVPLLGRRRLHQPELSERIGPVTERVRWPGLVLWPALLAVSVSWELFNFLHPDRTAHPTFSAIEVALTADHAPRAIAFALWLLLGVFVLRE